MSVRHAERGRNRDMIAKVTPHFVAANLKGLESGTHSRTRKHVVDVEWLLLVTLHEECGGYFPFRFCASKVVAFTCSRAIRDACSG